MKRLLLILALLCSLETYCQVDGDFACQQALILRCNKIPNTGFREIDPSISLADFRSNNIPGWYDCYGTSDVNFNSLPGPFVGAGYVDMGVGAQYEGITAKIGQVTAGRKYAFSFFIYTDPASYVQNVRLNVALTECQDFTGAPMGSTTVPALPNPHQKIYCEILGTLVYSPWKQVFVEFTAQDDFNMIRIFPDQTAPHTNAGSGFVTIAYPELIDVTNFSAGSVEYQSECELTISGPTCAIKNAYYTWRDPDNNIVQQGPTPQLDLNLNNNPAGNYTVTMTVLGATITNNTCSNNNPVITATVNVQENCNCGSLEITDSEIMYLKAEYINSDWEVDYVNQNLDLCSINNLCQSFGNGEYMEFSGTSNQTNGNIWQVRIVPVAPYTLTGNSFWQVGMTSALLSSTFNTYSTTNVGNVELYVPGDQGAVFVLEIKLINTILNTTRVIQIKNVPAVGPAQGSFWCVQLSPQFNYPHKVIFCGNNMPGYNYSWSFPAGMTILTPLTNCEIEFNDDLFNYTLNPNPVATLYVTNIYGCPPYSVDINIRGDNCSQGRGDNLKTEDAKISQLKTIEKNLIISPNPVTHAFKIQSNRNIQQAVLFNAQGIVLKQFSKLQILQQINIADLKAGAYFIKLVYDNNKYEVRSIIKQ